MATRRSRLQVKPNIGPKIGRGPTSKNAVPKQDVKPPKAAKTEKPVDDVVCDVKNTSQEVKKSPKKSVKEAAVSPEVSLEVKADDKSKDSSAKSVEKQTVDEKSKKTDLAKLEEPQVTENDGDNKPTKIKPKLRSRFPKVKPNVANIGRPDKRQKNGKTECQSDATEPVTRSAQPSTDKAKDKTKESPNEEKEVVSAHAEDVSVSDTSQDSRKAVVEEEEGEEVEPELKKIEEKEEKEEKVEKREEKPYDKVKSPKPDSRAVSIFDKPIQPVLKQEKKREVKLNFPKRNKQLPPVDTAPNRATMKMIDLIYWNPTSNPMKRKATDPKLKNIPVTNVTLATAEENSVDTPGGEENEDDDSLPVPQVKIGPDGNIIVNESSLVLNNQVSEDPMESEIMEEDDMITNYNSFREKRTKSSWSEIETKKFYKALSTVGTDFTLMLHLFPNRTRREIKNKFKREERFNRKEIDKAIKNRGNFSMLDFEKFQEEVELEEQKRKEMELVKKEKRDKKAEKRGEKRKKESAKENNTVRPKRKKKKRARNDEDDEDEVDLDDAQSLLSGSSERPGASKVTEVVEILMNMSQGKLPNAENDSEESNSESESQTDNISICTESSVFVPTHVKANLQKKKKNLQLDGAVEEDRTVDYQVPTNDAGRQGDLNNLVAKLSCRVTSNDKDESEDPPRPAVSPSQVGATPAPTVPTVSVTPDSQSQGPLGVQYMEIPENLLPVINTAGGADNVQIVLVHDTDAETGQTVVHVYVLPKSAQEFSIGGNTVHLTPSKTCPNTNPKTPGTTENQAAGTGVPRSPSTPYRRQSSMSVSLAQAADRSTVETPSSLFKTSNTNEAIPVTTPSSSHRLGDEDDDMTRVTSPSCLFRENKSGDSVLDLSVRK